MSAIQSIDNRRFAGISVDRLTLAEGLILVCARLWKAEYILGRDRHIADWRGGLCTAGVADIADEVMAPLMEWVFGAERLVGIRPLRCRRLTLAEFDFMRCIALFQHQRTAEAESWLGTLLPSATAITAGALGKRLAYSFLAARLCLPVRQQTDHAVPRQVAGAVVH